MFSGRMKKLIDAVKHAQETISDKEALRAALTELKRKYDAGEEI